MACDEDEKLRVSLIENTAERLTQECDCLFPARTTALGLKWYAEEKVRCVLGTMTFIAKPSYIFAE
jgi:hypothetical protein